MKTVKIFLHLSSLFDVNRGDEKDVNNIMHLAGQSKGSDVQHEHNNS